MNNKDLYRSNPLTGVKLDQVINELVEQYGWELLHAYLQLNCFKNNPSTESAVKFLKKTVWAQEKVENFYLYRLKNLPKPDDVQYELPPRDRIIPEGHVPGTPCELSFSDAKRIQEKKAAKDRARTRKQRSSAQNPWGN
ncbi:VF530 family DNA-binding protein [Pseudoalteromonas sp. MMG013]|uniref:VF530 family protein n=1 Tax=unclassified Pseudoalteromonas TaxID=194690 RepID=UPI001B35D809|nr:MULTISPECIES: VF530 family DNA-binding protein [unclassified Pseudoalteromonas]MBQ4848189.1 VF530 family DNA-binding protein [Pseudoalteromonas sp. MMG005]MBQ4851605.1 VF530 family DNA-binding protein [Pseudoalteromonas sp. MMG012]MBQ4864296.1 VF530 family DNA-binding protein [Pseudoalteromonas sp. MMG013]